MHHPKYVCATWIKQGVPSTYIAIHLELNEKSFHQGHIKATRHRSAVTTYHMVGNIGWNLSLADWWFWKQIAELNSANIS